MHTIFLDTNGESLESNQTDSNLKSKARQRAIAIKDNASSSLHELRERDAVLGDVRRKVRILQENVADLHTSVSAK